MSSCERSNSSGSDFGPPSVANLYSFSTGTQGSSRRCTSTRFACFSSSRSAASSSSRAACHFCSVPTFIGPPSRALVLTSPCSSTLLLPPVAVLAQRAAVERHGHVENRCAHLHPPFLWN